MSFVYFIIFCYPAVEFCIVTHTKRNVAAILTGVALNLYMTLGRTDIFARLSLPIHDMSTVCLSISLDFYSSHAHFVAFSIQVYTCFVRLTPASLFVFRYYK